MNRPTENIGRSFNRRHEVGVISCFAVPPIARRRDVQVFMETSMASTFRNRRPRFLKTENLPILAVTKNVTTAPNRRQAGKGICAITVRTAFKKGLHF